MQKGQSLRFRTKPRKRQHRIPGRFPTKLHRTGLWMPKNFVGNKKRFPSRGKSKQVHKKFLAIQEVLFFEFTNSIIFSISRRKADSGSMPVFLATITH